MGARSLIESQLPADLATADVVTWLRGQAAFRAPTSPRDEAPGRHSSGFDALDRLLDGGFLRGQISELVGSGGRTSLALGTLAAATRSGEVVAWVDAADALDPLSVQGAGVVLERFLWVRPDGERRITQALKAADLVLDAGGFAFVVLDLSDPSAPGAQSTSGRRPRGRGARDRSAWWVRLARKVEVSGTSLLCLGGAESFCSAMRLQCSRLPGAADRDPGLAVELVRSRRGTPGGTVSIPLGPPVD